ncbi:hypothetical protein F511_13972 [Dorcoceras hygrometricum]|uniref:Uncharacterized protein n=1 Tax=Dorcoceras hygrometricum TaxID=472368 RepID=A0A2Z7D297_9LAMI|nr:hypothetical protein F511_13972 [Dorcoceras hygrometricum]
MTFRVVRTNQYNQDLGLIHSTNGNHLESPKEGSSIDHQKEERYKRDEETDERAVERSKERSKDRRMRTRPDRRPNRKNDRKVLMAEESTKSWTDTDSDSSSSSSSSSSDSEQEEVHCLMADQTSDDEVFDFSNIEFTREDLVQALNDMVHEYKTLSHTFEEIKAENASLKNSSAESSSEELEDTDSLNTELTAEIAAGAQVPIVDDPVATQPDIVPTVEATTDDPDAVIKKVFNQLDVVFQTDDGEQPQGTMVKETVVATKEPHWFDLPYDDLIAKWDAERPVVTASDTDEYVETLDVGAAGGDQQVQFSEEEPEDVEMREDKQVDGLIDAYEKMSLEDILITIPVYVPLASAGIEITKITMGKETQIPGVDEKTQYLASLPKIPVIDAVDQFFHSFSLKKLATINIEELSKKEEQVLCWGETETTHAALNRKRTCCSKIDEGSPRDCGAIIARTNTNTPSTCWLRTMIRVDGVWVVEPFCDQWVKIPWPVVCTEVSRQCSFVDFFPVVSEPFRILRKRWADVCLEVVEFCASKRLLPVGSVNFCKALAIVEPDSSFDYRQPTVFALRFSQFCTVYIQYSLFSRLTTEDISSFVAAIASERTVLRNVQMAQTTVSVAPIVQLLDEHSFYDSSSDAISIDFTAHDTATTASISLPAAPRPDITKALNQLLYTGLDVVDVRRVVRESHQELNARTNSLDEQVAATRNDLLEFSAQAQQTLNIITSQLSELVAYINWGGDNKRGESSSSRGPQPPPPPVDQIRGTGVNVSTPDFAQRVDMAQRNIMERVMDIDRRESLLQAERDRERRRRELSGSKRIRRH